MRLLNHAKIDSIIAPNTAAGTVETTNPAIREPSSHKASVLKINEIIVNDNKFTGIWNASEIGFIKTCTTVRAAATRAAVTALSIVAPSTK